MWDKKESKNSKNNNQQQQQQSNTISPITKTENKTDEALDVNWVLYICIICVSCFNLENLCVCHFDGSKLNEFSCAVHIVYAVDAVMQAIVSVAVAVAVVVIAVVGRRFRLKLVCLTINYCKYLFSCDLNIDTAWRTGKDHFLGKHWWIMQLKIQS